MWFISIYKFEQISLLGLTIFIFFFAFKVSQINLHLYRNLDVRLKIAYIKITKIWKFTKHNIFYIIQKRRSAVFKNNYCYCFPIFFWNNIAYNLTKLDFANINIIGLIKLQNQLLYIILFCFRLILNLVILILLMSILTIQ